MIDPVGASWAIEALVASSLLMVLVLLLRGPVRRAFGAHVAYALWALPVLRLALPPMSAPWRDATVASFHSVAVDPVLHAAEPVTVLFAAPAIHADPVAGWTWVVPVVGLFWLVGAGAFFVWHAIAHRRFCARMLANVGQRVELDGVSVIESDAASGPLAFGIVRRYVAFPRDFAERYDPEERDLALAHEMGHHERGDLIANWIALGVLALHWFNPIAWRSFRAFRADQEIANDARVLAGMNPMRRHTYACAIVKAAHPALYGSVAATCHLNTIDDLKGRLRALTTQRISRMRLASGGLVIAALTLGGLGLTASGSAAAEKVRSGVARATGVDIAALVPPAVPSGDDAPVAIAMSDTAVQQANPYHRRPVRILKPIALDPPVAPVLLVAPVAPTAPEPPVAPDAPELADAPLGADGTWVVSTTTDGKRVVRHGRYVKLGKKGAMTLVGEDGAVASVSRSPAVPEVRSRKCGGRGDDKALTIEDRPDGRRRIVICEDRIAGAQARGAAAAARGAQLAANSRDTERNAYIRALTGLRTARARMTLNRDMSSDARVRALQEMDSAIADVESNLARVR